MASAGNLIQQKAYELSTRAPTSEHERSALNNEVEELTKNVLLDWIENVVKGKKEGYGWPGNFYQLTQTHGDLPLPARAIQVRAYDADGNEDVEKVKADNDYSTYYCVTSTVHASGNVKECYLTFHCKGAIGPQNVPPVMTRVNINKALKDIVYAKSGSSIRWYNRRDDLMITGDISPQSRYFYSGAKLETLYLDGLGSASIDVQSNIVAEANVRTKDGKYRPYSAVILKARVDYVTGVRASMAMKSIDQCVEEPTFVRRSIMTRRGSH